MVILTSEEVVQMSLDEYEVEFILNHRKGRGRLQFLVKWKGYADHENSWLPETSLENAQELLDEYKIKTSTLS